MGSPQPGQGTVRLKVTPSVWERLEDLVRDGRSPDAFYPEFLQGVAQAAGALGGLVWVETSEGLKAEYAFQMAGADRLASDPRHRAPLLKVLESAEPASLAPRSADNPSEVRLLLGPLPVGPTARGILELALPPRGDDAGLGLAVLARACHLAAVFAARLAPAPAPLTPPTPVPATSRDQLAAALERFTHEVHRSLDPRWVAYAAAHEGREVIGADRVSVVIVRGRQPQLTAASGVSQIERRSNSARFLERLVEVVLAGGDELWFTGDDPALAPQIKAALDPYVDVAHPTAVAVLPLVPAPPPTATPLPSGKPAPRPPLGALVIEQFSDATWAPALQERALVVAKHGAAALDNALAMDGLFLMPVWRTLGKARWLIEARRLPKTIAASLAVLALVAVLCLVPADFAMHGRGTLEPSERYPVYARAAGVVADIRVEHGQAVRSGDVLAALRNDELELQLTTTTGKRQEVEQSINGLTAALVSNRQLAAEQRSRMAGELNAFKKQLEGLKTQEALLLRQTEDLVAKSPADGEVITWDVKRLLLSRPVQRGDVLATVSDLDAAWTLEIQLAENRAGHLVAAHERAQAAGETLRVTFVLATDPGCEQVGTVSEIARRANLNEKHENTVIVRVAFDKSEIPPRLLRPGAAVTAKIACGRESLGYVWLHELFEWCQREVLFRL